jgi:hypothetical protein
MVTNVWVRDILFEMGMSRPKGSELWKDPFVAFYQTSSKDIGSVKAKEGRSLWREYGTLFLADAYLRPSVLSQLAGMIDDRLFPSTQRFRFRCLGIRTSNDAKIYEWFDESLDVPAALLRDPAGADLVHEALKRAEDASKCLSSIFKNDFRPQGSKRTWFSTLRERMLADYWARLARPFHELVGSIAPLSDYAALAHGWAARVLGAAEEVALETLDQVGDQAELLRRCVLAEDWLRYELNKRRKEWTND